ncbi:MAG: Fic family protein [Bacteroidota bacterium]|nr:Fic family protein [Bacteroidota bacterium]
MDISKNMQTKLSFDSEVYQQLSQQLSILDTFKGSWKMKEGQHGQYLKELRKIATIESTGSSTRIEGAKLTDEEVEKLLASVKITRFESRDEQEAVGYYDALEVILDNYADIEISERYVHQLHGILLKHSEKDQLHRGNYKTSSNKVVANYPDGTQRTLFDPTPPHLTPVEISQLIDWLNERIEKQDMHPLVYIAGFVYEFLSIHPYKDGNGRLSRLLTTLLMMRQGYYFIQYVSFENVIESSKDKYYRVLMDGQQNRYKDNERINAWILYFMQCLIALTERLDAKYKTFSRLKTALNKRQQQVLDYIRDNEPAQVGDIDKALGEYSRNTLKKDLAYLVQEKLLLKTGERKGTRYHILKRD